jgi:hypothetical protein
LADQRPDRARLTLPHLVIDSRKVSIVYFDA